MHDRRYTGVFVGKALVFSHVRSRRIHMDHSHLHGTARYHLRCRETENTIKFNSIPRGVLLHSTLISNYIESLIYLITFTCPCMLNKEIIKSPLGQRSSTIYHLWTCREHLNYHSDQAFSSCDSPVGCRHTFCNISVYLLK